MDQSFSRMRVVSIVFGDDAHRYGKRVRARARLEGLLDLRLFFFVSEGYVGSRHRLLVFVVARSWIQVAVWNAHVSAHFCSDPISNIFLIHWVTVCIVLCGSRYIQVFSFNDRLYSESKFW